MSTLIEGSSISGATSFLPWDPDLDSQDTFPVIFSPPPSAGPQPTGNESPWGSWVNVIQEAVKQTPQIINAVKGTQPIYQIQTGAMGRSQPSGAESIFTQRPLNGQQLSGSASRPMGQLPQSAIFPGIEDRNLLAVGAIVFVAILLLMQRG